MCLMMKDLPKSRMLRPHGGSLQPLWFAAAGGGERWKNVNRRDAATAVT